MKHFRFILLVLVLPLWGAVNQNNDVQLWVAESVDKQFSSSCVFKLRNEWRIGDDVSKLYLFYLEGLLLGKALDWMAMGPGYRQIWDLPGNQWRLTYLPFWELNFHKDKGRAGFVNRNRISYVMPEGAKNFWEYRGRIRWVATWEVCHLLCRPYVSNEIFVTSIKSFSQDRLMAGITVPFTHFLNFDFYFMLRFLKSDDRWTHQNIFGTWMNLVF